MLQAVIDLRSDTVTRPTTAMRAAIGAAEVGDDMFGEDPTVRKLEEVVATRLGKAAALFVPSGTMANQLAIRCHVQPGDDVLCSDGAHIKWYEAGAAAALAGAQLVTVGHGGFFTVADLVSTYQPERTDQASPPNRLLCFENTHNRGGGAIWPMQQMYEVAQAARQLGLRIHLDGARLWNAAVALGVPDAEIAAPFDTVSVCLSKGLGAPVGSLVCGPVDVIHKARRFRRMYGGAMRQAGVLAAAGIYALSQNYQRLAEDHHNARRIAEVIGDLRYVSVVPPQTNILLFDLAPPLPDAAEVTARLKAQGVLVAPFGPRRVRLVTHLDVDRTACEEAAQRIRQVLCDALL
ncbi:MAG TPA: GntG family PLP-dependent aldolase [Pseudomonadota bacterium]|jgi:threonine aldolase|nr:GntG family PLP-dependent aldolase [Pseudomonadota bacterium]